MQAPMRSGSSYFSYKGTHNIALMAACDSHYRIILVNIGESGSSDGEIFANSHFGIAFEEKTLNLPKSSFLPGTRTDFPYVLVGDETFPLKDYLMRPYPKEVLDDAKRIFGYRLSRARRTIENVFGIYSSRLLVLRKPIIGDVKNVISITKAVVSLHNYLINETRYISGPMEEGMAGDQNLQESFLPFR